MHHETTRRQFLSRTAAVTSAFTVLPSTVLAGAGNKAANERINVGIIGTGGQGIVNAKWLLDSPEVQITAICDVNRESDYSEFYFGGKAGREPARRLIEGHYGKARSSGRYQGLKTYVDFHDMLYAEEGIDAVLVATTDNVHAVASMTAMRKGKHVYCEKPLTKTVREARAMAAMARKQGVATQMGNQGQASDASRLLWEWLDDGAIGDVREVHVWTHKPGDMWYQGVAYPKEKPPVPPGLDWNRWLGPAAYRDYHPHYAPFRWRGWCDFGTGVLGDIGCHSFHPVFRALKLVHPVSVETKSTHFNRQSYPLAQTVYYEFAARQGMPPVRVVWYDNGMQPATPPELEAGRQLPREGTMIVGDRGTILNDRIIPLSKMKAYQKPPKTLPRSPGHHQEWLNAIRGGEPAGSNFDIAGPLTETVLLGSVSLYAGKKILWDPENMRITNDKAANQFLHREYREGWAL